MNQPADKERSTIHGFEALSSVLCTVYSRDSSSLWWGCIWPRAAIMPLPKRADTLATFRLDSLFFLRQNPIPTSRATATFRTTRKRESLGYVAPCYEAARWWMLVRLERPREAPFGRGSHLRFAGMGLGGSLP